MTTLDSQDSSTGRRVSPAKLIRNIAGALVLGALGSGLWELALRDAFFAMGNAVLGLIAVVWGGYLDFLHASIGKLRTDVLVVPIYAVFVTMAILGPVVLFRYLRSKLTQLEERLSPRKHRDPFSMEEFIQEIKSVRRMLHWQLAPLLLLFVAFFLVQVWQAQYTRSASTWSEQSIEILAPYIGIDEVLRLRSQLRSVQAAKPFFALEARIRELSRIHKASLPNFTSIGGRGVV